MQVILVDDDKDDLEMFCQAVLTIDNAIDCICFNDFKEFSMYLKDTEVVPDFIFCDLVMPMVTGVDCMREIRSYGKFNSTKLTAYSASLPNRRLDSIETFNAAFLAKPDSFNELDG